jgi:hypothetical protein
VTRRLTIGLSIFVLFAGAFGFGKYLSTKSAWQFGAPKVGQCWVGLASNVDIGMATGLHSVDCSSPHSSETIAILKFPSNVKQIPLINGSQLLTHAQSAQIDHDVLQPLLGPLDLSGVDATRLVTWNYPPSIDQWNHGARWLRIDFFVRNAGWPMNLIEPNLTFKGRMRSLITAAKKNPDLINYCIDTQSNDQVPTVNEDMRVITDCTQNPRWHLVAMTNLVKGTSEAFPGAAEVVARSKAACEKFRGTGVYQIAYADANGKDIYAANWDPSYMPSDCWVSKKP